MVTIADVAGHARVSSRTVSHALNGKRTISDDAGARAPTVRRSHIIALVCRCAPTCTGRVIGLYAAAGTVHFDWFDYEPLGL
jgi:hypothetical protein